MKQLLFASTLLASVVAGLGACAQVSEGSLLLFSTRVPAIALVDGQLLQGEVVLLPNRTGSVALQSSASKPGGGGDKKLVSSCVGQMRYTSTVAGVMDVRCDGGVETELRFNMLSDTKGYAYSQALGVPVSLTYGLAPDEARAYLKLPANKQLMGRLDSPELELR